MTGFKTNNNLKVLKEGSIELHDVPMYGANDQLQHLSNYGSA